MKKTYIFILLIIIAALYISCPVKDDEQDDPKNNLQTCTDPVYSWTKTDPNIITFITNDICYLGGIEGHYFWSWGNVEDNTTDLEVTTSKISGNLTAGYGVIFCVQDNNNFLCLLLGNKDQTGVYLFGKIQERQFTALSYDNINNTPWIESPDITPGHNENNTIKITYSGNSTFELILKSSTNTSAPILLTLDSNCDFTTGKYGYMVISSPYENFPTDPVEVKFTQILPSDIDLPDFQQAPSLQELNIVKENKLKSDSDFLKIY